MQIHPKKLNTWLTENVIALSQLVGFKAKAVDEEGVWCACTVEEITNDRLRYHFVRWLECRVESLHTNQTFSSVNLHNLSWTKSLQISNIKTIFYATSVLSWKAKHSYLNRGANKAVKHIKTASFNQRVGTGEF